MNEVDVITIVLADDHHVMRHGLSSLLAEQPEFKVVGEAGDGQEALRLVEKIHPEVLVLDMAMTGMDGAEVTRQVMKCSPATAVIILSIYGDNGYVRKAMKAGARAYVLKESTWDELVHAIHEVIAGRRYLSRNLSDRAAITYFSEDAPTSIGMRLMLTRREREVLNKVIRCKSAREIATELSTSSRTIEFHRANIMRKIGVHNQKELIRYCVQAGLLSEED